MSTPTVLPVDCASAASTAHDFGILLSSQSATSPAELAPIPAYLEQTFRGRIQGASVQARILGELLRRPNAENRRFGTRDLLDDTALLEAIQGRLSHPCFKMRSLVERGLITQVAVTENKRYALIPQPAVAITGDRGLHDTRVVCVRVALDAYSAFARGLRESPFIRLLDVHTVYQRIGSKGAKGSACVSTAFRQIARWNPRIWRLHTRGRAGEIALAYCPGEEAVNIAAYERQPEFPRERMVQAFSDRVSRSDPPLVCLNDFDDDELKAIIGPSDTPVRESAREILATLVRPIGKLAVAPLTDLGVLSHKRFVTVPEQAERATHAFELKRIAHLLHRIDTQQLRGLGACSIPAVQAERIEALVSELMQMKGRLDAASCVAKPTPWMVKTTRELQRKVEVTLRRVDVTPMICDREAMSSAWCASESTLTEQERSRASESGLTWSDLRREAEHVATTWGARRTPYALAIAVQKRATRVESGRSADGRGRIGLRARYHRWDVRTSMLALVADPETRMLAAHARRSLGPNPSLGAVCSGLSSRNLVARATACFALCVLEPTDSISTLSDIAIRDPEPGVREIALRSLALLDAEVADRVLASKEMSLPRSVTGMLNEFIQKRQHMGRAWESATGDHNGLASRGLRSDSELA